MITVEVEGKDVSQLVGQITWSGDTKNPSRKLVFTIAQRPSDRFLPKVTISEGDTVAVSKDGKSFFAGKIFDVEKSSQSNTFTYTAFDFMYYVLKNEVSLVVDTTAEGCAAMVCDKLGITLGGAVATGVSVYFLAFGKAGYEVIMAGYTEAAKSTGKKYMVLMKNLTEVHVIEKGELCGVVLSGDYNLVDASYKASVQQMVNRVVITDKNGNEVSSVEDAAARSKYGTLQKVYIQEDGKDSGAAAKAMLQDIEQSGSISGVPSDLRAVSGYAIIVQDKTSGLCGKFYIESDTHTFADGKEEMQLTLAFSNLMDEVEITAAT